MSERECEGCDNPSRTFATKTLCSSCYHKRRRAQRTPEQRRAEIDRGVWRKRARYMNEPGFAERERERARAYHREHADEINEQRGLRYWSDEEYREQERKRSREKEARRRAKGLA